MPVPFFLKKKLAGAPDACSFDAPVAVRVKLSGGKLFYGLDRKRKNPG